MPETFYVRTRDLKHYIEAKILTDLTGNPIVSRNPVQSTWNLFDADHNPIGTNTNGYVIVPADFDINKAIDFGRSISEMMKASADNPDNFESNLIDAFARFGKAFYPRTGELDIQTHYNGATGDNVPAFRDAASYIFGVAGHAAGIPLGVLKAGGGAVNLRQYGQGNVKDISGDAFNSPENVNSMTDGYRAQQNRVFGQNQTAFPPLVFGETGIDGSPSPASGPDSSPSTPIGVQQASPATPNGTPSRHSNALAPPPETEGPIGLFSGKPMRFLFAPIFQTRTPSDGDPDRRSALDDMIWNGLGSRAFSPDAGTAQPLLPGRRISSAFRNVSDSWSNKSSPDLVPPMPVAPDSQGPLSLNDAYLEYLRRLGVSQS